MDWLVWAGFAALIALFLFIDLGVLNRRPHAITTREALGWTGMWVSVALTFSVFVYFAYQNQWFGLGLGQRTADGEAWHYPPMSGLTAATLFLTGYVVEYSLSLDNMFVIAMIMLHLRVPAQYQHRVLFWGIIGAVVMRGVMILTLTELLEYFRWLFVVFGLLLIFTAVKMLVVKGDQDINTESSLVIRAARRLYPVTPEYHGQRFLTSVPAPGPSGTRMVRAMTPLMLALLLVETADLVFAIDSIPAIMGITLDPFIVLTSNVFAILGLRSLYFALAGMMDRFEHLKTALVFVLAFIGMKMIVEYFHLVDIHHGVSVAVIGALLSIGVLASVLRPSGRPDASAAAGSGPPGSGLPAAGGDPPRDADEGASAT